MMERTLGAVAGQIKGVKGAVQSGQERINYLENRFAGIKTEFNRKLRDLTNRAVLADIQLIRPGQRPEDPAVPSTFGNFSYARMEYFAESLDGDNVGNDSTNYIAQLALVKPTEAQRGNEILQTDWWIPQIELNPTTHDFKQFRIRSTESAHDNPLYITHVNTLYDPNDRARVPTKVTLTAGAAVGTDGRQLQFSIPTRNSQVQAPWHIPQVLPQTGTNTGLRFLHTTGDVNTATFVRTPIANYHMAEAQATGSGFNIKAGDTTRFVRTPSTGYQMAEARLSNNQLQIKHGTTVTNVLTTAPDFDIPVEVAHARDVQDGIQFVWGDAQGRNYSAFVRTPTGGYGMASAQIRGDGTRNEVHLRIPFGSTYRTFQMAKFSDLPSGTLGGSWSTAPTNFSITRTGTTQTLQGRLNNTADRVVTGSNRTHTAGSTATYPAIYFGSSIPFSVMPIPSQTNTSRTSSYDRALVRVFTYDSSNRRRYSFWYWDSPDTDKFMVQGSRITSGTNRNRIKIRVGNETGYIRSTAIIWD